MLVMDDDDVIPEEWLAQVFESCHTEIAKEGRAAAQMVKLHTPRFRLLIPKLF